MKRLISTVGLSKTEWLKQRKRGITGTDAGAITGMNPYVSAFQVYQDKRSEEITEFDNEAMRQGRDLEEYVAKRFTEETGLKVRKANAIYVNEEHPIMLADFDRLVIGEKAGLECKTVSPYSSDKWNDDNIPLHYQLQVQHYLGVSGFDCWYIAALILGQKLIIRKVERDEELIRNLITIEERFWERHIINGVLPDPDGTKNCSEQIARLYFKSDFQKSVELHGVNQILDRRAELMELIDKMNTEKNQIEQTIKLELQDAAIGITDRYYVSWNSYESTRIDTEKLRKEEPELYKKYSKTISGRRFLVKAAA